jgi:hypothetical protein
VIDRIARLGRSLLLCRRDDAKVVRTFYESDTVDNVEAIDKVTFFDEFLTFCKTLSVWPLLEALDPGERIRATIAWGAMVGVYAMRLVMGLSSAPLTEGVILTDRSLMALFGLAAFVDRGVTRRGLSRVKQMPKVRGAFSGEVIADTLVKVSLSGLARTFNAVVKILAQAGYFPGSVHAVCDCTDCEATPKYRMLDGGDVASVTREKRPDHRHNRHAPKVKTTVWGWKIWLLFCPTSGIPIAIYVDRINVDDRAWMTAIVCQGKDNLGHRLKSIAFDRGFWDGDQLHLIAVELGVPFFIPGKADLEITQEARRTAREAHARYLRGLPLEDVIVARRPVVTVKGRGKHRREESQDLVVIGLSGLDCPTYAAADPGAKIHSKSFVPGRLNAAVVVSDPSYPRPDDKDKLVVITPASFSSEQDVLFAYDRFDERGVIENTGNKQAKQEWKLEAPLEKSEAAVYLHAHFVFMLMGLLAAFRMQQQADEKSEAAGEETGMGRYRRAIERENRDKVLIRDAGCYAVIWVWEMALLCGKRMRDHEQETASMVLARYGAASTSPPAAPPQRPP